MRRILAAVAAAAACALGAVQIGSDAIFARAGEPASLPAHLPPAAGTAIYRAVARVAPAPYVDAMLARAAINRGDLAQAQRYALRLPASAPRDDLLGEIAQRRGDARSAQQYFVRAGDIEAISRAVRDLAPKDPASAYALESALLRRLERSGTHPDAVAEAYWQLGNLAWQQHDVVLTMRNYRRAVTLSPLSEKFLLSAGFRSYDLHDDAAARGYFARVIGVNPGSADGYAGAGMVALRTGDRARAEYDAARARANDPHSHALSTLEAQLRETAR